MNFKLVTDMCSDIKGQGNKVMSSVCRFPSPPLPFGGICFVVLVMRKGGESS